MFIPAAMACIVRCALDFGMQCGVSSSRSDMSQLTPPGDKSSSRPVTFEIRVEKDLYFIEEVLVSSSPTPKGSTSRLVMLDLPNSLVSAPSCWSPCESLTSASSTSGLLRLASLHASFFLRGDPAGDISKPLKPNGLALDNGESGSGREGRESFKSPPMLPSLYLLFQRPSSRLSAPPKLRSSV
jgi:hypothetical protein